MWNDIGFRDLRYARTRVFQLCDWVSHVIGNRPDVIRCRGAHVRMTQDPLNHQVVSKSPPLRERCQDPIEVVFINAPRPLCPEIRNKGIRGSDRCMRFVWATIWTLGCNTY